MTFRRFVWRNALRNKRRTGLTTLSIGFSLFLLMALLTFMEALLNPVDDEDSALRLITSSATSLANMMPISYQDKIRRVPGVEHVAPLMYFNGVYKDPAYQFANFATDPKEIWEIYSEQTLSEKSKADFIADRTGAVAGADLAERFGWKLGDKITLQGTYFPIDLELTIVGIFTAEKSQNILYFRYDYMNEALDNLNLIGAFTIRVADAASVPVVSETIDNMFRNSPAETKTESEKAFVLGFISMLGNIQVIIASVAGVVVFTMLLVAVSTMAMAVRERIRDVAILKAIGYRRNTILRLVMAEALGISLAGVTLGVGLGESLRFVDLDKITQGFIPEFSPAFTTYAAVLGAGLLIGLISGFIPAWQASKMTVTGAMRQVE